MIISAIGLMSFGANAYLISDTCGVDITVSYTSPSAFDFVISLTNGQTTGELTMQPGTFTVTVDAMLCSDPSTVAFTGESNAITLDGSENTATSVDITILDQETFSVTTIDQSVDYDPIIISMTITPGTIGIGESATVSIGALDPAPGKDVESFVLTPPSNANGAFDKTTCTTGTSCSYVYTSAAGDSGNLEFSVEVQDESGNSDAATGVISVDDTSVVNLNVNSNAGNSAPTIDTEEASPTDLHAIGDTEGTITISLTVSDADGDAMTINTNISALSTEGTAPFTGCDTADVTVTGSGSAFTVVWSPWNAGDTGYGTQWCTLTVQVEDSNGAAQSNFYSYNVVSMQTATSGPANATAPPVFLTTYLSSSSPTSGDEVTVYARYFDDDSGETVSAAVAYGTATTTTSDFTVAAATCTSASPCEFTTTFLANGPNQAHDIVITITDSESNTATVTKSITISASGGGRRRAQDGTVTGVTSMEIKDGKLTVKLNQRLGDSIDSGKEDDKEVPSGGGLSTGLLAGIVAGAGVVVLVIIIAIITMKNRSRGRVANKTTHYKAGETFEVCVSDGIYGLNDLVNLSDMPAGHTGTL